MLTAYFERLYAYNFWANTQLLNLIESNPSAYTEDVQIALSHYIAAQEIWASRIAGRAAEVKGVWEKYSIEQCKAFAKSTADYWEGVLATLHKPEDYTRKIAYKNTKGDYYETPIVDIVGHCVNHATYHRAQIARMLREKGVAPVNTDYITYCRLFSLDEERFSA